MAKTEVTIKGGTKLAAVLARVAAKVGKGGVVKVGFLQAARYPDGTAVAQVAFWNEFGTTKAPPRPFFRAMLAHESPDLGKKVGKILKATDYDSDQTLGLIGTYLKDKLTQSIAEWTDPPNSETTIARKGFNKPLVDTGTMQRAPDFVVEK